MPERPNWDVAARRRLATQLRGVRGQLAAVGSAEARQGALATVAQIERTLGQLGRLLDRVESAGYGYGMWLETGKNATTPAALLPAESQLDGLLAELAATVAGLGRPPVAPEWLAAVGAVVEDLAAAFEARLAALAATAAPAGSSSPGSLAGVAPGQRVLLEGEEQRVAVRTIWKRGDASLQLADPRRTLLLWQDTGDAAVVLFEEQLLAAPNLGSERWEVEGVAFQLAWHDDGGGHETGPRGRRPVVAQRRLYVSKDGVWAWWERRGVADMVRRGTALAAGDLVL